MISLLHDLVSKTSLRWPDKTAIIESETAASITYGQLNGKVQALSGQILQKGLKKHQRVGILSSNSIQFAAVYFAVSNAGGIVVPLNYTLNPLDIIRQAKDCALSGIYIGKGFEEKGRAIISRAKSIRFTVEDADGRAGRQKLPIVKDRDVVSIIYTSGTTGRPLGVMLSHKNLISNSRAIVKYLGLTNSGRVCCVLPFYYIYGLSVLFSHFLAGATVIIENRFMYPNTALDSIEKYRATGFSGVSSHYALLLYRSDFKKRKLSSLRYFTQAGDSMPACISRDLLSAFPDKRLYIMYGQTEASPRLTYLRPNLIAAKPNSIGKAIPGVKIRVVDEKGRDRKAGQEGEIIARGDNVMRGYWGNKKETKRVIKGGWLYTGDIAFKDKEGDLYIVGRKKDFIKVGGHRINPVEIENLVKQYDRVLETAVVGVPDLILGTKVKLFVSAAPGKNITAGEIMRFCKRRLPSYKIPSEVIILKSIPKNSFGKIDREALK